MIRILFISLFLFSNLILFAQNKTEVYISNFKDIAITDGTIKQKYQEKVKAITLANFTELISKSGLKIIDIFGNYKLEYFNTETSDRLILICKK